MERKEGRGEHRPRHLQMHEDSPHQDRRDGVQHDVYEVEAERIETPDLELEPVQP